MKNILMFLDRCTTGKKCERRMIGKWPWNNDRSLGSKNWLFGSIEKLGRLKQNSIFRKQRKRSEDYVQSLPKTLSTIKYVLLQRGKEELFLFSGDP